MRSLKNIKAVLFDLDGTLSKTSDDLYVAWSRAFKLIANVQIDKKEFFLLEGVGVENTVKMLSHKHGLEKKDYSKIIKLKNYICRKRNQFKVYDHANEIIDFIKENNILIGLVTGGDRKRVIESIPHNFAKKFHTIITKDDVSELKPSPEPFLKCAKLMNIKPKESLAVENAPQGILSAKEAGMFCLGVTHTLDKIYLKEADRIIDNLLNIKEYIN